MVSRKASFLIFFRGIRSSRTKEKDSDKMASIADLYRQLISPDLASRKICLCRSTDVIQSSFSIQRNGVTE